MLHHISTTEYLNYETGKFSKSSNRGIFGNHVAELPFLTSAWRFYLLMNRPETSDSIFNWDDFKSKINTELEPKPGNLVHRVLSYVYKQLDKKVPTCTTAELTEADTKFLTDIKEQVTNLCEAMEVTRIRESLRIVLDVCTLGNQYMQENEIWGKTAEPERKRVVLAVLCNAIRILCGLFEPFMPGFSAIVYFFLGVERVAKDEQFLKTLLETEPKEYINLLPRDLVMNRPIPIFQKLEDIEDYRTRFK